MIINSNDIFSQIGLAVDQQRKSNYNTRPKYLICLEIELNEDEKHVLEVRDYDDPHLKAFEFCKLHKLNKLAVQIVEDKIREAMEFEEQKLIKYRSKSKSKSKLDSNQKRKTDNDLAKSQRKTANQKKESPGRKNDSKQKSKSKSKMSKTASSDNIYLRGLVKSRLIEQQRNKMKVEIEKKEEEKLTFKPKINNVSQKIVEFLRTNDVPKPKKSSPTKRMYDEMAECTFKPKINKVSERIVSNKSVLKEERDNHKKLYDDTEKSKKTSQTEQYSFQPKINPKSSERITIPFFKRLQITQDKKNQAMNERQTFYDEEECSFQPKINRGPLREREKENKNIWEYLYNESKKENESTNQVYSSNAQLPRENTVSQQYYENLIEDRINTVFETLDSNNDGLISPNEIAIERLPAECLHFLKPIFMEMDQIDAVLNCYQFKRAVKALMADSDPGVKGAFLSAKWKKEAQETDCFRPSINKKSKELSCNRSIQNLYKEGLREKQNREYRLEKERALKEERQLLECSFKPVLNHSSKVYIDRIARKKYENKTNKSVSELGPSFMQEDDGPE